MNEQSLIPEPEGVMDRRDILQMRLSELRRRHRTLDEDIASISRAAAGGGVFELQRLKKEKLALRDEIARIEDQLTPDIIA